MTACSATIHTVLSASLQHNNFAFYPKFRSAKSFWLFGCQLLHPTGSPSSGIGCHFPGPRYYRSQGTSLSGGMLLFQFLCQVRQCIYVLASVSMACLNIVSSVSGAQDKHLDMPSWYLATARWLSSSPSSVTHIKLAPAAAAHNSLQRLGCRAVLGMYTCMKPYSLNNIYIYLKCVYQVLCLVLQC